MPNKTAQWRIETTQNMAKTTNLIAIAHEATLGSCFLIRPSPGSCRTDFIPIDQIPEVNEMIFVSNRHILVQFNNQKFVTFKTDGSVFE